MENATPLIDNLIRCRQHLCKKDALFVLSQKEENIYFSWPQAEYVFHFVFLLLSSKNYSVYTTVQKIQYILNTAPLCQWTFNPLLNVQNKKPSCQHPMQEISTCLTVSSPICSGIFENISQCKVSFATIVAGSIDNRRKLQWCKVKNRWPKDHRFYTQNITYRHLFSCCVFIFFIAIINITFNCLQSYAVKWIFFDLTSLHS